MAEKLLLLLLLLRIPHGIMYNCQYAYCKMHERMYNRQYAYCNAYMHMHMHIRNYCGSLHIACITADMHIVRGMSACITGNMHIVMHIALHKICISGNAYTHMHVHMHIRITDCFFPQHLLMWVSLTSSPEHTARQCRNFTFPATAVKWQNKYSYYHYCCGAGSIR